MTKEFTDGQRIYYAQYRLFSNVCDRVIIGVTQESYSSNSTRQSIEIKCKGERSTRRVTALNCYASLAELKEAVKENSRREIQKHYEAIQYIDSLTKEIIWDSK